MTVLCHTCERPDPTSGRVCADCADRARAHFRAAAELTPAGRAVAAGLTRRGPAAGGTGTIRLQLNLAAAARLDAVQNELTTWARHVADERGEQVQPADPIVAGARYLAEHVEWAGILECATCGYVIVTGNYNDPAHAETPFIREGLSA